MSGDDGHSLEATINELEGTVGSAAHEASPAPPPSWTGIDDRYEIGDVLGKGYHGEVLRVVDQVLGREVAMKVVHRHMAEPDTIERFVAEARLMAQIGHPNVMPVYDAGRLSDGRPFYTMPLLEHRTLAELIEQLQENVLRMSLVRLMRLFANACMAVHAAHEKGVVHRDLKPHNMLIGPSGELLLTDFGLARLDAVPFQNPTMPGTPIGTPLYMSPEQARGERETIGPHSDVYSLGAVLYELLTFLRPIQKDSIHNQLVAILEEVPEPPHRRAPHREVPIDLSTLCQRCLAKDPAARPPSAAALVDTIEGWLEGRFEEERRREECERRIAEARRHRESADAMSRTLERERAVVRRKWSTMKEHTPLADKEPLWLIEEDLQRLRAQRDEAEMAGVAALEAALSAVPGHARARDLYIELQLARRERFRAMGDEALAHRAALRAIRVGGEVVRDQLFGTGQVSVRCVRPVTIETYVARAGRLVAEEVGPADLTTELVPGSYRLRAEVDGVPVYLPFTLKAGERRELAFYPERQALLPERFALIHGGRGLIGGDPDAPLSEPAVDEEIPDFGISRRPVSCAEYLAWLRTLDDPNAALLRGPRATAEGGPYWKVADGQVVIPSEDDDGDAWDPEFPVFGISARDAEAYLAWRSTKESRVYRLPTDREWERASRGADGRLYPWGDRFDPSLCKMRLSRAGQPRPEPIGAFLTDLSPFAVIDMAGSIAEWTSSPYRDDPKHRCIKGGAWSSRAHRCAASFRGSMNIDHVSADLGFRAALDL